MYIDRLRSLSSPVTSALKENTVDGCIGVFLLLRSNAAESNGLLRLYQGLTRVSINYLTPD